MMFVWVKKEVMEWVDWGDYGGVGQVLQEVRVEIVGVNLFMFVLEVVVLEDLE